MDEEGQGRQEAAAASGKAVPVPLAGQQAQGHLQGKGTKVIEQQAQREGGGVCHGSEDQECAAQIHPKVGQAVEGQQGFFDRNHPFHFLRRNREENVPVF